MWGGGWAYATYLATRRTAARRTFATSSCCRSRAVEGGSFGSKWARGHRCRKGGWDGQGNGMRIIADPGFATVSQQAIKAMYKNVWTVKSLP